MGFLSGILSNIKEHLGQHKNEINIAIEALKQNKHAGKNGFNVAIVKVVAGVRGYNGNVKSSNEAVKKPIEKLKEDMKKYTKGKLDEIKDDADVGDSDLSDAVTGIGKKYNEFINSTFEVLTALSKAEEGSKAISDLNHNCKNKIINAEKTIRHEYDTLQMTFQNQYTDLERCINSVNRHFSALEQRVNSLARDQITKLVDEIKKELSKRKADIESEKNKLNTWLNDTTATNDSKSEKEVLEDNCSNVTKGVATFSVQYTTVNTQLSAIKKVVQDTEGTDKLETFVEQIAVAAQQVGNDLGNHINTLNDWMQKAKHAVTNAKGKMEQIVNLLEDKQENGKKSDISKAATELQQKAQSLLTSMKGAKSELSRLVGSLPKTLDTILKPSIAADLKDLRDGIRRKVVEYFEELGLAKFGEAAGNTFGGNVQMLKLNGRFKDWLEASGKGGLKLKNSSNNLIEHASYARKALLYALDSLNAKLDTDHGKSGFNAMREDVDGKIDEEFGAENSPLNNAEKNHMKAYKGTQEQVSQKIKQIETDVNDNHFKKFDDGQIAKIDEGVLTEALRNVNDAIGGFTNALRELIDTKSDHSTNMKYYLTRLDDMLCDKGYTASHRLSGTSVQGFENITAQIANLKKNDLDTKSGRIYDKISTVAKQVSSLEEASKKTTVPDETLIKLVDSLPDDMGKLSSSIEGSIQVIEEVNNKLGAWLITVAAYIERLKEVGERHIHHFATKLKQEISLTSSAITTEIRKRYVRCVKRQLRYFADTITSELSELPTLIDTDRHIGFKGFMEKFYGDYVDTLNDENIKKLSDLATAATDSPAQKKQAFEKLSSAFAAFYLPLNKYLLEEITRVNESENNKKNPVATDKQLYGRQLFRIYDSLNELTTHIKQRHRYDCMVPGMLDKLGAAIDGLKPDGFSQPSTPIIDCVSSGFTSLVYELRKAYTSVYDSQQFDSKLVEETGTEVVYSTKVYRIEELTTYGRKCAKVCLSIVPIVTDALSDLKEKLDNEDGKWKKYKIYNSGESHHSLHRLFFTDHGYDPGLAVNAEHGELNHRDECIGERILRHLKTGAKALFTSSSTKHPSSPVTDDIAIEEVHEGGVIADLFAHRKTYMEVCHLIHIDKPRTPCNVYEMLVWLTGLPHHQVYGKLEDHIKTRCVKPKTLQHLEYSKLHNTELRLEQTSMITAHVIMQTIENVCTNAPTLLTTILGTGDELTVYASDFSNNALRFTYPTSGEDCLHTFLDILRRLWSVLRYLEGQCGHPSSIYGWRDCQYGKAVDHSNWQCEDHPRKKPTCQANFQPKCQAACQPNTQANCQPASPLMSYFNDCLPGHLPHRLESIGCKSECKTCSPKSKGQPCLTPLGFRAFSGSTKPGKVLCKILDQFLNSDDVSCLFALAQSPPATLAEHFGFTLSLVKGWHESTRKLQNNGFQSVFIKSYIAIYSLYRRRYTT
ncbi:hypothetical protein, conserved, partial [Babesia bigemina]